MNFKPRIDYRSLINLLLLLLTFFTTAVAGVQWLNKNPYELSNLASGLPYAFSILFVLGAHEFGHYFAARHHNVNTTLPFFIPFPPLPFLLNFGTFGAVIRTRSEVPSRKAMFDIGVAGPIAGFVACIILLIYGFLNLPNPEYILTIHPDYDFVLNGIPGSQGLKLEFGSTLAYSFIESLFTKSTGQFIPPMSEIYHYPYLCVGWFGLFVTAMNLIPIGQFDGGHLIFTMFGDKHKFIVRFSFGALLIAGSPAFVESLIQSVYSIFSDSTLSFGISLTQYSWAGWFIWALISYYGIKLYHPPVTDDTPLDPTRMYIGWLTICIFIVSFSLVPFTILF
ncbi:MAG: site-2 protease family protein [bacterium]